MTTRRDLLRLLGAAAVGSALPAALRAHPARRALDGIGVQLYTLRADMRRDPEGTLARIASIGFDEIEWWGEFDRTPQQLRALLDRHGLRSPAWHVPIEALAPDRLSRTIETATVMGQKHLIVAWTAPDTRTADGFQRLGNLLSDAGRAAAPAGIRTGYHNHDFEFVPVSDGTLFDLLVAGTDAAYVDIELDCYWAYKAGHDPIALVRRLGDRITHLHLKDSAGPPGHRQMDVGAGVIDWPTLLREATARRVRHAFVEHDEPADAWATASAGLRYVRSIGY